MDVLNTNTITLCNERDLLRVSTPKTPCHLARLANLVVNSFSFPRCFCGNLLIAFRVCCQFPLYLLMPCESASQGYGVQFPQL